MHYENQRLRQKRQNPKPLINNPLQVKKTNCSNRFSKAAKMFLQPDGKKGKKEFPGIHPPAEISGCPEFIIIDQKIVWDGSINLLSYGSAEESMMRIESNKIAYEFMGSVGENELSCKYHRLYFSILLWICT